MSFHLWCSSKSIVDDYVWLRLFQCKITSVAAKWYIELPHSTYSDFSSLASMFLQYFQLLVRYDEGVEILLSSRKKTTHIMDHIHEWWHHRSFCKIQLDDRILLDAFLSTLLPPISKDMVSQCPQTKEESILMAQQFDLIYAQSGYLYTIIPDGPRVVTSCWDMPRASHAANGVIDSITQHP